MTKDTTTQPATTQPMSLENFIRFYELAPNVPLKRAREILNLSHSRIYKLAELGVVRFRKNGRFTELPVHHLYDLVTGDAIASATEEATQPQT